MTRLMNLCLVGCLVAAAAAAEPPESKPAPLTKEQQDELQKEFGGGHLEYYAVSEQAWNELKDGASLALTWGDSKDFKRQGVGKLDKSKLQRQK